MGSHRIEPSDLIGVDEAGRGPLAGPLVVAAVRMRKGFKCPGLGDSKQLSPTKREECFARIVDGCEFAIEVVDVETIDRLNILRATLQAMATVAGRLRRDHEEVWVDGNCLPPLDGPVQAIIKGDGSVRSISAASVVAKVTRDRLMVELDQIHRGYGFYHNFGYGTPDHLEALRRLGPTVIHRRSFAPVSEMLNQPCLALDV